VTRKAICRHPLTTYKDTQTNDKLTKQICEKPILICCRYCCRRQYEAIHQHCSESSTGFHSICISWETASVRMKQVIWMADKEQVMLRLSSTGLCGTSSHHL